MRQRVQFWWMQTAHGWQYNRAHGSCKLDTQEHTHTLRVCNTYYLYTATIVTRTRLKSLTPNDPYRGRTAPLTFKRCILYIYSTNIGAEYFKHNIYSPFFSLQNAVCFIILTYLVPVLFTFYIQVC
jgi:hypothetical protein